MSTTDWCRRTVWGGLGVLTACGSSASPADARVDAPARDTAADASPCDPSQPFGEPVLLGGLDTALDDRWGWLASDELTIYFARGDSGGSDLYRATRAALADDFGNVQRLDAAPPGSAARPITSGDGLTLYMEYGPTDFNIDTATRASVTDAFGPHAPLAVVNTTANEFNPWISADGLTLYFTTDRAGFNDIFRATRTTATDAFSPPAAVTELNSAYGDYVGALSVDGLEMFMASSRDTAGANLDIFHAVRSTPDDAFSTPVKITELSGAGTYEYPTWVSPDRCRLLLTSNRPGGAGGLAIWSVTRR